MQANSVTVDRQARSELQDALVKYMRGEINTFSFDDRNSAISTTDRSVQSLSRELYAIHDDLVDHPISVSLDAWLMLRRVVAFLESDLHIVAGAERAAWPFRNEQQWLQHESLTEKWSLPDFDPLIHSRQINHWTRTISTSQGIVIIATVLVLALLLMYLIG